LQQETLLFIAGHYLVDFVHAGYISKFKQPQIANIIIPCFYYRVVKSLSNKNAIY